VATVDAPHEDKKKTRPPQGKELKAPFGELAVTGRRQNDARADCGRTFARWCGHFDALFVALKWACWLTKPRKRRQRLRIVVGSMARKRVAANFCSPVKCRRRELRAEAYRQPITDPYDMDDIAWAEYKNDRNLEEAERVSREAVKNSSGNVSYVCTL
jgi:hypothetical protein